MTIMINRGDISELIKSYLLEKFPELANKSFQLFFDIKYHPENYCSDDWYEIICFYEYLEEYLIAGKKIIGKEYVSLNSKQIIKILKEIFKKDDCNIEWNNYYEGGISFKIEKKNEKKLILGG